MKEIFTPLFMQQNSQSDIYDGTEVEIIKAENLCLSPCLIRKTYKQGHYLLMNLT
jgi:hypothetical protein